MNEIVTTRPLSRVALICKTLSVLCMLAFFAVVAWTIAVLFLVCYSLFSSTLPSDAVPIAYAIPIIILLYMGTSSLLPFTLWRMLRDLSSSRTPFTFKNADRLRFLGFVMLLYTAFGALLSSVDSRFMLSIGNDSVQVGNFIYDLASDSGAYLNLFSLVIAAVFFALSYVFKYGVLLQQESDETL